MAATLLADVNPPGSQEDLVSNLETVHSLMEDAPRLLALAVAYLPLCFWQGNGQICSQLALLWFSRNPSFCEQVRLCLRLELLRESDLSLSFFSSLSVYPTVWVAVSC